MNFFTFLLRGRVFKVFVIMKLTLLLILLFSFNVSASLFAQQISLNEYKAPLSDVLKKIEKQSGFTIIYEDNLLKQAKPVTLSIKNATLAVAIGHCLEGQPLTYSIVEKTVILKPKEKTILQKISDFIRKQTITGKITDENGRPLSGATIKVKASNKTTTTNTEGIFSLKDIEDNAILIISYIGYQTKEIKAIADSDMQIRLQLAANNLDELAVVFTGYQTLPKERVTGSFVHIDNQLLNRSVGTNILDRLEGVTSGLIFNKTYAVGLTNNQSTISIRGRNTIYANPSPLIVIDNFPFNGDLSSINPNDIESVTILKDAAAASIWGAFSGNGVIVITSKKGKYNQKPKIELNSNITIGELPDLYYNPRLSSSSYIDVEQFLFNKGYFNSAITRSSHPVLSPVVDILVDRRNKAISSTDSATLINKYKGQDSRDDMSQYLYRKSINQQYSLNVSGGGKNNVYYFSTGFDKNLTSQQRNGFDRISINASNTYTFLNDKLTLTNAIYFTKNKTDNNGLSTVNIPYPYLKLKDQNGNALSVPYQYRQGYVDTVGHGNLLDWKYRPLDELSLNNNTTKLTEYRINTQLRYTILTGLDASIQYQYNQGNSLQNTLYSQDSYYARDYINKFTQYNTTTGTYLRPVPLGGIRDNLTRNFSSHNARGQLNYNRQWGIDHQLSVLGGYEIRDINASSVRNRIYGYSELGTSALIDYTTFYKYFYSSSTNRITSNALQLGTTNRYLSYFANFAYTLKDRYIISGSARKDESNIFGVNSNRKGVPLWSVGASWEINKEKFYRIDWLPYLRLRITNGYNGNVDNTLSSLITATVNSGNYYNVPYSSLTNPPNPELRWEKVNTTNFGVDFSVKRFLTGTAELYLKKGKDLIGTSLVDPTVGVTTFKGNFANMKGKGVDITLNSQNIKGKFGWNTTLLLSYTKDEVTKYQLKPSTVSDAISSSINPIEGNPLYSLYAFQWAGLDAYGDPQVYLDGNISKDYSAIFYSTDLSNLKYQGTANPTTFGSLRNDFSWKGITLSANITFKLGYYFRRSSLSSSGLYTGQHYFSDADYLNRWQKVGDEAITNVPVLSYPADNIRDLVYGYSSILIEKGDHIRFQDISLGYQFDKSKFPILPFASLKIYGYVNNIGMLWRENKAGLDPDYVPNGSLIYPNPRSYSLGAKIGF